MSLATPAGTTLRKNLRFAAPSDASRAATTSLVVVHDLASADGLELVKQGLAFQASSSVAAASSRIAVADARRSPAGLLLAAYWNRCVEMAAETGVVRLVTMHSHASPRTRGANALCEP